MLLVIVRPDGLTAVVDLLRALTVRDVLTGVALIVSAAAFVRSRRLDRRDLFLRIHEMLLEPEVVQGRRRLYRIKKAQDAKAIHLDADAYTKVHRSLALFDLLAKYVNNGWIDERTALEEWGRSLTQARQPGRIFIEVRAQEVHWRSWPDFVDLADRAERFKEGTYTPQRIRRVRWRALALTERGRGAPI